MIKKFKNFLIGILVLSVLFSPIFIKVKVECKSQIGDCPNEVVEKLKVINGKNLLNAKGWVSKVLTGNFLISNYSAQLKLPNILMVNVIVKKPIYAVYDKTQNSYSLVDSSGYVLSVSGASTLPTLVKETVNEKVSERIAESDLYALKLIQGINQMYQISIGTIQNDTLVVDMPLGIRVILPLSGYDTQVLLGSLRLIYTKVTTSYDGVYSQIDMRFKNPVIR